MRQLQSLLLGQVLGYLIAQVLLGVPRRLYFPFFPSHVIIMLKNISIQRLSPLSTPALSKNSTKFSQKRQKTSFNFWRNSPQGEQQLRSILEVWQMVSAIGMEISEEMVVKYLSRRMREKSFTFTSIIISTLRDRRLPVLQKKMEDFNESIFSFEIEQMKEELEQFLTKRINKDINLLQEKIIQADHNVKDSIDVEQYQRLVCSFRPLLITNSTDLAQEYQSLGSGAVKIPKSSRIEQIRYAKLTQLEHQISHLHNKVYLEKSDARLFPSFQAINKFF